MGQDCYTAGPEKMRRARNGKIMLKKIWVTSCIGSNCISNKSNREMSRKRKGRGDSTNVRSESVRNEEIGK